MENKGDTKGAELASGAAASLNQASHLREEATLAHNKVQEASDSVASSQRRDFQESRDMTQPFLEYVAKQPTNNDPNAASSPIGKDRAVSILKEGGAEYEAYREGFRQENPACDIQRVNTFQVQQNFESQYQAQSTALKASHSPESHHAQNKQSIERHGQSLGLAYETFKDSGLKQEVGKMHKAAADKFKTRKDDIVAQTTTLQKQVDTASKETVVGSNIKQTGGALLSTLGPDGLDPSPDIPVDQTPYNSPLNRK